MVEIPLTAGQFEAKAEQLAKQQNIFLAGTEGRIEKSGVTAGWQYADGLLKVTILEKPFFVSTEYCEEQLKKFLAGV
jgi:hypothetical protein